MNKQSGWQESYNIAEQGFKGLSGKERAKGELGLQGRVQVQGQ